MCGSDAELCALVARTARALGFEGCIGPGPRRCQWHDTIVDEAMESYVHASRLRP